jgi:peptidoglycan/xylan/chitin deacetylase (PgdA/CDA1 family)
MARQRQDRGAFVLNYEEGGENSPLHGDPASETFLSELISAQALHQPAHVDRVALRVRARAPASGASCASSRSAAAADRVRRRHGARALPRAGSRFKERGHEIACHGWRWIHYQNLDEATEREHMRLGMEAIEKLTCERALGWYTGRDSPRTRRLVADYGGFEYDSDYYGDDLPFWMKVQKSDGAVVPQLIVPYTLDCNDMRFALPQGYSHADPFFQYMKDSFDALYAEGRRGAEDDEHRHALPAARAARAHHRAAALPRPHRHPRPGLGLHALGHRAALGRRPIPTPPRQGGLTMALTSSNSTRHRPTKPVALARTASTSIRPGSRRASLCRGRSRSLAPTSSTRLCAGRGPLPRARSSSA